MKKTTLLILAIVLFAACKSRQDNQGNNSSTSPTTVESVNNKPTSINITPIDTIQKLFDSFRGDSAYLKIDDNRYIIVYAEIFDSLKNIEMMDDAFAPRCPSVDHEQDCKTDLFQGCDRAKAKTTMLTVAATTYPTVRELLNNLNSVSPDTDMKAKQISGAEDSRREPEEKRNVLIQKAYLYTIYREPDNDFHIVIGSSPVFEQSVFLNVEVSGTPRGASATIKNKFMRVRDKIKNHPNLGEIKCSTRELKIPFLITNIKGSLFFDSHHPDGVGRGRAKPKTAWEVHPIQDLTVVGVD